MPSVHILNTDYTYQYILEYISIKNSLIFQYILILCFLLSGDQACSLEPCANGGTCSIINGPSRRFICNCPSGTSNWKLNIVEKKVFVLPK